MGRTPLLLPMAAIISGILLAGWLPTLATMWVLVPIIIAGILLIFRQYVCGFFLIFLSIGYLVAVINRPEEIRLTGEHQFRGNIVEIREASTSGRVAIVKVEKIDSCSVRPFKLRVNFLSERPYATAGMIVDFTGEAGALSEPPDIPDVIDLSARLRRKGVVGHIVVTPDNMILRGNQSGVIAFFRRLQAELSMKLQQCDLKEQTVDMLLPMLLGESEYLTAQRREIYSAAGLSHLLALSGMHVGIIAMLISIGLWPLFLGRHNRTRSLLTIIALWGYALLTGMSPSVTRAVIMTTIYLLGNILERDSVSLNSLFLAAILILIVNPEDLYSIGFQMSFAAVAGIILFYPLINRVSLRNHPWLYKLASLPSMSLAAMSLTGVISAFHFHSLPLLFVISNLLVAPFVPLLVCGGAVVLLFSLIGVDLAWMDWLVDISAEFIDYVAKTTAAIPFGFLSGIYFPGWFAVCLCLSLIVIAVGVHRKRLYSILQGGILLIGGVLVLGTTAAEAYPASEAFFIDDYRHQHLFIRNGDKCQLYTTSHIAAEREEYREFYALLLQDYLSKRGVDSLELMPVSCIPAKVVDGDTLRLSVDSCRAVCAPVFL